MTSFYIVLLFCNSYFTTCIRKWLKDSLTCHSKLGTKLERKGDKFYFNFASGFGYLVNEPGNKMPVEFNFEFYYLKYK